MGLGSSRKRNMYCLPLKKSFICRPLFTFFCAYVCFRRCVFMLLVRFIYDRRCFISQNRPHQHHHQGHHFTTNHHRTRTDRSNLRKRRTSTNGAARMTSAGQGGASLRNVRVCPAAHHWCDTVYYQRWLNGTHSQSHCGCQKKKTNPQLFAVGHWAGLTGARAYRLSPPAEVNWSRSTVCLCRGDISCAHT